MYVTYCVVKVNLVVEWYLMVVTHKARVLLVLLSGIKIEIFSVILTSNSYN